MQLPTSFNFVRPLSRCAVALGFVTASGASIADPTLQQCLDAAQKIQPGDFIKLEYLDPSAEGGAAYEIELSTTSGREWEFMCDVATGQIFEMEQEVDSADHPLFAGKAKVSLDAAKATVLSLYDGKIEEVEYEIEANGDVSYEMDVVDGNGTEFKVEVDAATGAIIEVAVEQWEIGEEPDEQQ
ncbi:MAG: PepSY domain-containing protein [Pseudomonadota bacterium]